MRIPSSIHMRIPYKFKMRLRKIIEYNKFKKPLAVVPDVEGKIFLFIGGLHRSGTSILHRLLREHPNVSGFHNTAVSEDEGQHLQTVFPVDKNLGGSGRFAFNVESHIFENSALASEKNRNKLLMEWGAYFDLSKKVLLEKTPSNIVRARFFQAIFPKSKFVFIVRHPIPVSLATQKWSQTSIIELMMHWYVAHKKLIVDTSYINDYMIVRYEDLTKYTKSVVDDVFRSLEIEDFDTNEKAIDFNQKYFDAWEKSCAADKKTIENVAPHLISFALRFGYSFNDPYVYELSKEKLSAEAADAQCG